MFSFPSWGAVKVLASSCSKVTFNIVEAEEDEQVQLAIVLGDPIFVRYPSISPDCYTRVSM